MKREADRELERLFVRLVRNERMNADAVVSPALRPEQWAALEEDMDAPFRDTEHREMWAEVWRIADGAMDEDRHAIAAIALRDQPFGFTHDTIDLFEMMARFVEMEAHADVGPLMASAARREIEKIRALLPPRGRGQ